jgi:hypothetical protein
VEPSAGDSSSESEVGILNLVHKFLTTAFFMGGATEAHGKQFLSKQVLAL